MQKFLIVTTLISVINKICPSIEYGEY